MEEEKVKRFSSGLAFEAHKARCAIKDWQSRGDDVDLGRGRGDSTWCRVGLQYLEILVN